jgi:C4-dicarboxylate-binding protein DctP
MAATPQALPRLDIRSLRELAGEVPALSVLELPFFYPDLAAVHRVLDSDPGSVLRASARERGWEILGVWDEGLQAMSGNQAYIHPGQLQGKEFILLREDPIAEMELRALDVWSRPSRPASLGQLHKECVVGSRSATLQQISRERLASVHLDLTLTRHRYEAWVVAMSRADWAKLKPVEQTALREALRAMQGWQRERAQAAEAAALAELTRAGGMTAHPLPPDIWARYRSMQPEWTQFLSPTLPAESRRRLVVLAATAAGVDLGRGGQQPATQVAPQSP